MTDDVSLTQAPGQRSPEDAGARTPDAPAATAAQRGPRTVWLRPESRATRGTGDERRAIRRALRDWDLLRTREQVPSLTELAPLRNPVDWSDRFLLACDWDPARSVFVLCGSRVEKAFGQRVIGRTLEEVAPHQGTLLHACSDAMREQAAFEVEDAYRTAPGRLIFYRAVFMPVRGVDSEGAYLMGAYGCVVVTE